MSDTGMAIGGRLVLASGSFVTNNSAERISFRAAGATFEFQFTENALMPDAMKVEFVNSTRIAVILNNFSNSSGTAGNIIVGNYQNAPLHLAVIVHYVGKGPTAGQRLVNYTLSQGG
jgi:hypothetical protein